MVAIIQIAPQSILTMSALKRIARGLDCRFMDVARLPRKR
jgi:hypothetical protein